MKTLFSSTFILCLFQLVSAQTFPADRLVDWSQAGVKDSSTTQFTEYNVTELGLVGDTTTPNDAAFQEILADPETGTHSILYFPPGEYLFQEKISLPSDIILSGAGADHTQLTFDLNNADHAIEIKGALSQDTSSLVSAYPHGGTQSAKGDSAIIVNNAASFQSGEWILLSQIDTAYITSSWAENTVGQVLEIKSIEDDTIFLDSPLRHSYPLEYKPYITTIETVENTGIECLKIFRKDDTSPLQSSNILFQYAANCWITGIESDMTNFSHFDARYSSNLSLTNSYFHHSHEYGGGGRGYGVTLQYATGECLVENNVFEHLRHSMLLQAGANGNVFTFNYSTDPFWETTGLPSNSAGEIVLHGNYPYSNLFEQNIVQNIVIDNSHGPNGPDNTLFMNRANLYGIFFSASNSPSQIIVENEVTNTESPYSFVNYTILGENHFLYGNNNKGTITPDGTGEGIDTSLFYAVKPPFVKEEQWKIIGPPNQLGSSSIPAQERYEGDTLIAICESKSIPTATNNEKENEISIYPNPTNGQLHISGLQHSRHSRAILYDMNGVKKLDLDLESTVNLNNLNSGVYILLIRSEHRVYRSKVILKK